MLERRCPGEVGQVPGALTTVDGYAELCLCVHISVLMSD